MPTVDYTNRPPRPKLLVLELWGLGDLTFVTSFLTVAQENYDVTLVGKAHAEELLKPSHPDVQFIAFDAPWTAYRGKYRLWRWRWGLLASLIHLLRSVKFDAAVSVRADPRDHLLMFFAGAKQRYGFPFRGSELFLSHALPRSRVPQHKVEDWRVIGEALMLKGIGVKPQLSHNHYQTTSIKDGFASIGKRPILGLHPGARISVRRWPERFFVNLIEKLRNEFNFDLVLISDGTSCCDELVRHADLVLRQLNTAELVDALGRIDLLLCNDSGPGHIASACGRPVIPIFGPTDPDWFRPWGDLHHVVIRDICPWRPCFDYCKFSEPYCMTKLLPERVFPEICEHLYGLIERGILPRAFAGTEALPVS